MDEKAEFAKKVPYFGVSLTEYAETIKKNEIQLVYNNTFLANCNKHKLQYQAHYVCIYVLMYIYDYMIHT